MLLIKCFYLILFNHILYKLLKICSVPSNVLVYIIKVRLLSGHVIYHCVSLPFVCQYGKRNEYYTIFEEDSELNLRVGCVCKNVYV